MKNRWLVFALLAFSSSGPSYGMSWEQLLATLRHNPPDPHSIEIAVARLDALGKHSAAIEALVDALDNLTQPWYRDPRRHSVLTPRRQSEWRLPFRPFLK